MANIMKINRLDTHDRLLELKKDQGHVITQGCDDCLKRNPLSLALQDRSDYIYIFAHARTQEDGRTKIMYWQPRLSKPQPQTNSFLFRAISKSDVLEVCWMLPDEMMWQQYKKGFVTESEEIRWYMDQYENHREALSHPFPGDLNNVQIKNIYLEIAKAIEDELQESVLFDSNGDSWL